MIALPSTLISPAVPDLKLRVHVLKTDWRMGLLIVPIVGMMALRKLGTVAPEARVKGTLALVFADPSRISAQRFAEMVDEVKAKADRPWMDLATLRSTRGIVRSMFFKNRSGWASMREVQAPTLVIWGERDRMIEPEVGEGFAAAIPGARLRVLNDTGHLPQLETPEAVLAALDEFLPAAHSSSR